MTEVVSVTCTLTSGGTVIFDAPDTVVDDQNENVTWFDVFQRSVGA